MVTNGIASPLIESVTTPFILQAVGAACAAVHNENINPNNIENNHEYTIPKYRAIYLDSLKYNMVKTNNLFDEFINKFKKYKKISLDIKDDILREYQVVGVKWL